MKNQVSKNTIILEFISKDNGKSLDKFSISIHTWNRIVKQSIMAGKSVDEHFTDMIYLYAKEHGLLDKVELPPLVKPNNDKE